MSLKFLRPRHAVGLAGLALAAPARAQSEPPGVSQAASTLPDLALILDVAGAYFSDDGGQTQTGGHDPNHTGFTLQALELAMGANADHVLRLDANVVFLPDEVELEEAYLTTLALPGGLQARAGQFLTRFGRLNPTHPHAWSFVDQPLANGRFLGPEGSRGVGAELSWLTPLPWFVELVGSGTEVGGADPGDLLFTGALKQFFPFTDDLSLLFGLSTRIEPDAAGEGNRADVHGADLYLRWKPVGSADRMAVSWQTEYMYRRRQLPLDVLTDHGGYTQLVAQWSPRWETGLRAERVEPATRYSTALTFRPSHFSRLRLQGSLAEPHADPDAAPVWATMLSLEVVVGPHGAHEF